jgi:uncharacterized membrane protein
MFDHEKYADTASTWLERNKWKVVGGVGAFIVLAGVVTALV